MKEKLIGTFEAADIFNFITINNLLIRGYEKTEYKFMVEFAGSKGYMSHIEIKCEGYQEDEINRIYAKDLFGECGWIKNIIIEVFHSDKRGVRIHYRDIQSKRKAKNEKHLK